MDGRNAVAMKNFLMFTIPQGHVTAGPKPGDGGGEIGNETSSGSQTMPISQTNVRPASVCATIFAV